MMHVVIEVEAMLENAEHLFTTQSCCIYKVPYRIRKSTEDAYTPVLVSIEPLHHGNFRLVTMEAHKQVYCERFIRRSEACLSDLVSCVQHLEPKIHACYSEKIDLIADELVKVIFIDCCFVIEFFSREEWTRNDAIHDLLLLENQVPLFVFEKIYNLIFASLLNNGADDKFLSFMELAFDIFKNHNKQRVSPPPNSRTISHFTDLLRCFILPPSHRIPSRNHETIILGNNASELVEAGVKFQVNESSHGCIFDLEFQHGILKISRVLVDDDTEVWLRNIVTLENCHYPKEHYITDYVYFLKQLVNSNKDADVLVKAGIVQSMMSDNNTSVAKIFSDVGKKILVVDYNANYLQICHDLNAYYKHPWHTKIATLRSDYFTTPLLELHCSLLLLFKQYVLLSNLYK